MKKILMLIICIGALLSLTACGTKEETEVPDIDRILRERENKKMEETDKADEEDQEAEAKETEDFTEIDEDEPEEQGNGAEDDISENTANEDEEGNAGSTVSNTEPAYRKVNDTRYASANLNIRSGPGTNYSAIGSLLRGQEITRIGITDNGWGVINYNGGDGYVSDDYLVTNKPADQTPTSGSVDDPGTGGDSGSGSGGGHDPGNNGDPDPGNNGGHDPGNNGDPDPGTGGDPDPGNSNDHDPGNGDDHDTGNNGSDTDTEADTDPGN